MFSWKSVISISTQDAITWLIIQSLINCTESGYANVALSVLDFTNVIDFLRAAFFPSFLVCLENFVYVRKISFVFTVYDSIQENTSIS